MWFVNCEPEGARMRTRRQNRYEFLRKKGFLPFEARPISFVPIKTVPYMKPFIGERWGLYKDALRHKAKLLQYEDAIRAIYDSNKFLKRDKSGKMVRDPWAMLRDFEDRYRAKYPAYESPWEKRRRSWTDFLAKIEQTIATQSRYRRATA